MQKKTSTIEIITFILAALTIVACFGLAYLPRDPATLPPTNISNFAVLEDPSGTLTFQEAFTKTSDLKPLSTSVFFHKRTRSAFWFSFSIDQSNIDRSVRFLEIDNPALENISVYFPGQEGVKMGRKVDIRKIPIKTRNQNILIPENMPSGARVLLRVETTTIMLVPLKVIGATEMTNKIVVETLLFGCFFGIIIAIFFVNLFSLFMLKNHQFTIYMAYLASLFVYQFRVHGFSYLIPLPFSVQQAILWISLGGLGFFMMLFAKKFLDLKKRLPVINVVLDVFIGLFIVQTLIGVLLSSFWANQLAYITGFIVPLIIIISTAKLYFSGFRETRFYLLAWCSLFTGTLIWSTAAYAASQIPSNYFFVIGTSIDSLLFTLAIFDQIKSELNEKEVIVEREKHYKDLSRTDSLTGLFNRRYMDDMIKRLELEDEISNQHAIIMIDLDNFKQINDSFGHPAGDLVLMNTATQIRKHIRRTDIASRYGGDEFLIFLPGATSNTAEKIAEEIRHSIFINFCTSDNGDQIDQTVSIGITENRNGDSFDASLLRADAALYKAKNAGRNCVSIL